MRPFLLKIIYVSYRHNSAILSASENFLAYSGPYRGASQQLYYYLVCAYEFPPGGNPITMKHKTTVAMQIPEIPPIFRLQTRSVPSSARCINIIAPAYSFRPETPRRPALIPIRARSGSSEKLVPNVTHVFLSDTSARLASALSVMGSPSAPSAPSQCIVGA